MCTDPKPASWNKRLFAYMMSKDSAQYDAMVSHRKRALLGNLHGNVLEIGPGTAPNLAFYPPDVTWLGIEPNPAMFPYARREAQRVGKSIELREGQAEQLPVDSASVDAVV